MGPFHCRLRVVDTLYRDVARELDHFVQWIPPCEVFHV